MRFEGAIHSAMKNTAHNRNTKHRLSNFNKRRAGSAALSLKIDSIKVTLHLYILDKNVLFVKRHFNLYSTSALEIMANSGAAFPSINGNFKNDSIK